MRAPLRSAVKKAVILVSANAALVVSVGAPAEAVTTTALRRRAIFNNLSLCNHATLGQNGGNGGPVNAASRGQYRSGGACYNYPDGSPVLYAGSIPSVATVYRRVNTQYFLCSAYQEIILTSNPAIDSGWVTDNTL